MDCAREAPRSEQYVCFAPSQTHLKSGSIAITGAEIQAHIKKLLSKVQLRILVVGNMYREVRVKQMI